MDNSLNSRRALRYLLLPGRYAICRLQSGADVPGWAGQPDDFYSVTRSADELSIVCMENRVPADVHAVRGWLCLRLEGPFDFSETSILSSFLAPLAENGVGIFAVSTFDTDYVLIQERFWPEASDALRTAGHEEVVSSQESGQESTDYRF